MTAREPTMTVREPGVVGKLGRIRDAEPLFALVRRISGQHPEWGEDRIAEELAIKLGVRHSTSTIRRYMVRSREPRGGQRWKTFITNHARQVDQRCDQSGPGGPMLCQLTAGSQHGVKGRRVLNRQDELPVSASVDSCSERSLIDSVGVDR